MQATDAGKKLVATMAAPQITKGHAAKDKNIRAGLGPEFGKTICYAAAVALTVAFRVPL
jgi:hypothetical protein